MSKTVASFLIGLCGYGVVVTVFESHLQFGRPVAWVAAIATIVWVTSISGRVLR